MAYQNPITFEQFTQSQGGKILSPRGVDIKAQDHSFRAVNYGALYGDRQQSGAIKVSIMENGGENRGYGNRMIPRSDFPQQAILEKARLGFAELEHLYSFNKSVGGVLELTTDMTLDDFVAMLREGGKTGKGIRFEGLDDLSAPQSKGIIAGMMSYLKK